MTTYKMNRTTRGALKGEVHSKLFHEGKTYEIDDDLAGEFEKLGVIEPSDDEVTIPQIEDDHIDLHENWLDTDPAVLRHGELTAKQVIAKDESPFSDDASPAEQEEGKPEGDEKPAKARGKKAE